MKDITCITCGAIYTGVRQKKNSICKSCVAQNRKSRYQANRQERIKEAKEYREKNKAIIAKKKSAKYFSEREEILKKVRDYYQRNKEKVANYGQVYRIQNKESVLVRNRNRKSKLRTLSKTSDITNNYLIELLQKADECPLCKMSYKDKSEKHIDHIIPICVGGCHKKENVRVICRTCNLRRPKDGRDVPVNI